MFPRSPTRNPVRPKDSGPEVGLGEIAIDVPKPVSGQRLDYPTIRLKPPPQLSFLHMRIA
jgi:hypothetical protein